MGYRRTWCRSLRWGRLKGLGLDNSKVSGMTLAWTPGAVLVSLPVYYQWSFETGPQGDFASLVRKNSPKPLAPSVGFREMDVANPGLGLPPAADTALPVEGALKRYPEFVPPPQTGPDARHLASGPDETAE